MLLTGSDAPLRRCATHTDRKDSQGIMNRHALEIDHVLSIAPEYGLAAYQRLSTRELAAISLADES